MTNTPEIRFRGFADAWKNRRLGDEFERVNERNNGQFDVTHWISVAKMYYQDPDKVQSNNLDTRTYVMRLGDVAFEGNPNAEFQFGRFVANDIGDGIISELFPIYRHKLPYNNSYWKRAIQIEWIMNPIYRKAITIGGASSNKLIEKHFLRESIPIPSLKEQEKIGKTFEALDQLIALHRRKVEKLTAAKKALLVKLFPQDGETVPAVRFEGFTGEWECKKVSELFKITRGGVLPATLTSPMKTKETPYPVYSSQTKDNGLLGYYKKHLYENAITWTTDGANAGTVKYRAGKFYCTNVCGVLLSDAIKANQMVAEVLNRVAKGYVSYGGNPKLMNNVMADIEIQLPAGAAEQEKIGAAFEKLDRLIALHRRKVEKLTDAKKALLNKMFPKNKDAGAQIGRDF